MRDQCQTIQLLMELQEKKCEQFGRLQIYGAYLPRGVQSTDVHFSEKLFFFLTYRVNPQSSSYKYANEALQAVALPLGPIGTSAIL